MFIHCRNSECKNYFEDSCMLNLNNKMVCFNESGQCESLEAGKNEAYQDLKTDAVYCDSRKEGMCSTRDYGINQYKDPCYKCCLGCKGAIEMTCSLVCSSVVEHYYPEMETEG